MSLYNIDLFISYAHIDNKPLSADKSGWISRFHESLNTILSMRLGKDVRIWRDDKLQGNDRFAEEIVEQFNSTAVLISVLTPRYLNSEWCTREVDEFCKKAQNHLFVDHKARIFKVVKSPVDSQDQLPSVMQELLGYDFFIFEDGVPMELDDAYGKQYGEDFTRKVSKLAYEIADLLKRLNESGDKPVAEPSSPASDKPIVYLAECTYDIKHARDAIETQLNCLGYHVLPDRELPGDETGYTDAVKSFLERSDVAVHLIGQQYGAVPHGPIDRSTAHIQNQLAAQASQNSKLERLIWLCDDSLPDNDRQLQFIDALQNDSHYQQGADLLIGDIEKLKTALQNLLNKVEKQANSIEPIDSNVSAQATSDDANMYLICTEQDIKASVPLRKYLQEHNISVSIPAFSGDAAQVRELNQQLLINSNSIMVYYGEGEEAWKRSIDTELKKLPAFLEGRPAPPIYTYLAAPHTYHKDDMVEMEVPGVLNGIDELNETALDAAFSQTASARDVV